MPPRDTLIAVRMYNLACFYNILMTVDSTSRTAHGCCYLLSAASASLF